MYQGVDLNTLFHRQPLEYWGVMEQGQTYHHPFPYPCYAPSENSAHGRPFELLRVLYIHHLGITHRRVHILDSDKKTVLYKIRANKGGLFSSKPHMIIKSGATHRAVGTVTFHRMSPVIDLEIHHHTIPLLRLGLFTSAHRFESPTSRSPLKWKRDGLESEGNMLCVDGQQVLIARFERSRRAKRKGGKFLISPGVEGRLMDEVVVSGLAMVQYHRRHKKKAAAPSRGHVGDMVS